MTFLSILPILLIAVHFLLVIVPVRRKPGWLAFLPGAALVLLLMHILVDGFQVVFLGVYIFVLALFLINLRAMLRQLRQLREQRRPQAAGDGLPPRRPVLALLGRLFWLAILGLNMTPAVLLPFNYHPAAPGGPFAVGTVAYAWTDPARLEDFTPDDPADQRKIAVQFWYPVDAANKTAAARENAPLSAQKAQYPLVIFSHGAFGVRASNLTTYMELASRGYIVASIDHAYHAFYTSFPGGGSAMISQQFLTDIQRNQSGAMSADEDMRTSAAWLDLRTADIRFTLDQVSALNAGKEPASPLAGHIDESKIGLFGHSLGGAAAAAVCRTDARCKSAAVIDATMFGEYEPDSAERALLQEPFPAPLMIFYNGDTYNATPEHLGYVPDVHAYQNAAAGAYSVVVNGAQHLNFTDLPARAPLLAQLLGSAMTVNGGTAGAIPQDRCMEILNSYLTAFFDQTLLGQPSTLLSAPTTYPEVDFESRPAQ